MTFETLGLSSPILNALIPLGYQKPTPVQAKVIPLVLEGKDVIATAQTGTGKTAAYALPLLQLLSKKTPKENSKRNIRGLVLVPTRELASQVYNAMLDYSANMDIVTIAIYGGVKLTPQTNKLQKGADVLIAPPGRLLEHLQMGHLDLAKVELLVFDEADLIVDMGFWKEVEML